MGGLKTIYDTGQEGVAFLKNLGYRGLEKGYRRKKNRVNYYPFGATLPGRSFNSGSYRYGFNGMEKDDEIKGSGNSYDFGARMLDPRIGRWMSTDPKFGLQPGWSPYKFGLDNPIIFIDPDGNTEFYSIKGKWIGTDGVNNNVVAKVTSGKVKREIEKVTRSGLNYQAQSINKAAERKNGMLLINKDVLSYSNNMLGKSLKDKGKVGEYGGTMTKNGDNYTPVESEMRYSEGLGNTVPSKGDVSVHSHPTGILDEEGRTSAADKPSDDEPGFPGDESAFKKFETNIVVGKNGRAQTVIDPNTGKKSFDNNRASAINIFGKDHKKKIGTITGNQAGSMLKGDRGRLGRKFDKKSGGDDEQ